MVDSCYCKILFLLLFFFLSRSRCEKKPPILPQNANRSIQLSVIRYLFFFLMVFVPEKTNIWTVLRSIFYVPRLSIAFHFLCRYSISHLSHFARVYHVPMYAFLCYSVDSIGSWKRTMCRFFFLVSFCYYSINELSFCFVAMDIFNGMASVYLSCCRKLLHFPCHSLVLCAF